MATKQEREIEELIKKVAALQAEVKDLAAKCATKSAPAAPVTGDWLDKRTFKIWQKKVAQKLGWEL